VPDSRRKEVIQVLQAWKNFLTDEAGAEVVEYILVTIIVLVFTVLAFIAFGQQLRSMLQQILTMLKLIPTTAE
jgi:Flp pilus assembly pilin Flp